MIIGVGTDLIEKERVQRAISRPSFLTTVFTASEQELIAERKIRAASNFAAKEAVVKAFGTGFTGIRPAEIEILRYPSGQPYVVLYGAAKEKAGELGVERILLSITDTAELTQAYVVLEGRRNDAVFGKRTGDGILPAADRTGATEFLAEEVGRKTPPENAACPDTVSADTKLPVLNAAQMKEVDRTTIQEYGILSLTLMERAAAAVTERVLIRASEETVVGVLCGTGNNGGDGLAVARQLKTQGYKARVLLKDVAKWQEKTTEEWQTAAELSATAGELHCTEEFLQQLGLAKEAGVELCGFDAAENCDLFVDALFGIGLGRDIAGEYEAVIRSVAETKRPVIAVDIASGICADTGKVRNIALPAAETVTFGAAKCGHLFYPGKEYTGELIVSDIGFPKDLLWEKKTGYYFKKITLPKRPAYSNKGTFGKVAVIAGSRNMAGAAYFSAYAAGRTGAGLIKVVTTECNRGILQTKLPEAMLTTYAEDAEANTGEANRADITAAVQDAISFATALVIGPGLGKSETAGKLVRKTVSELKQLGEKAPVSVWDADALNLLSEFAKEAGCTELEERIAFYEQFLPEHAILTPHPGELSRLTGRPVKELLGDLCRTAAKVCRETKLVFVIKDAVTVVAQGTERFVQTAGNSGMATGGSGDVLTGVIAALAAGGRRAFDAAADGVWLHGLAGDAAAGKLGEASLMASDIAYALAGLLGEDRNEKAE